MWLRRGAILFAIVGALAAYLFLFRTKIIETENAKSWEHQEKLSGIRFRLPPTATISEERGPDFLVYRISIDVDQHHLLEFYVGNHPMKEEFNQLPHKKRRISLNGAPGIEKHWIVDGGNCSRELIVSTKSEGAGYIHLYYADLKPADAALADDIISSLEIG